MKRFVIGDIHGRKDALNEVLEKSKLNFEEDKLIILGDIVDGGYFTYEVVEILLKIKNIIFLFGNHDEWFMNHLSRGWADEIWIQQGGANTLRSYGARVKEATKVTNNSLVSTRDMKIPITHQEFFNNGKYYHVEDNMLFVHGGYNQRLGDVTFTSKNDLLWDRILIRDAYEKPIPHYKKIFVGHTTTQLIEKGCLKPIKYNNLWVLDTGAGWTGRLTIMNIDNEEFWQSKIQTPDVKK